MSRLSVNRYHGKVDGEHVEAKRLSKTGVLVIARADLEAAVRVQYAGLGVSFVECGDTFGHHLIVGAVSPVGFAHSVEQFFAAVNYGVPYHDLGAARRCGPAVGSLCRVA